MCERERIHYINRFRIKTSNTEEMKLVFTAHSKYFFFCRDVVCEFVMKQGFLPINPFRVFDYFLSDRVNRNLVRRGNNQLIRTCDELWVFGNIADGVLFEIVSAIEQNKPVKFFTIGSELADIKEIPVEKITFEPEVHAAKVKKQDLIDFIKTGHVREKKDDLFDQISIYDLQIDALERKTTEKYDVAVIGLGPSGMMALDYLSGHGIKVLGIEKGKLPNQRSQFAQDIASGFGGAGLFSDGKLSFFPSGSKLWNGLPINQLRNAYKEVKNYLGIVGCEIPIWKDDWHRAYVGDIESEEKRYDSVYFDKIQSHNLISRIYNNNKDHIIINTKAVQIRHTNQGYEIVLSGNRIISAAKLLIATGKLGNVLFYDIGDEIAFKSRFEYGIRIETDSENYIPIESSQVDYKIIRTKGDVEIRTFCCCKDGIVIESCFDGISDGVGNRYTVRSFNGGIAEEKTGRSNIGITIRSERKDSVYVREIQNWLKHHKQNKSTVYSLQEFRGILENEDVVIGHESDRIISKFVPELIKSNSSKYNTKIYLPEIEYYGQYPVFDWNTLRIPNSGIWIAGDVSGEFRGLIPSMISGVFAAQSIEKEME